MKKLLVVDGNSILNRAFYGIRLLSNKNGVYTNAIYGMINMLYKQIEDVAPDYAAVAFDLKAPTFRHKMYDAYKAGRSPMPDELRVQFPYAKRVLKEMGFTVIEKEGYEADDILGTLALNANERGVQAYVLTGDRDSLQLINDNTTVLLATNQDTLKMDRAAFVERYGVQPEQFVDVKALMGDSSDNIPGVAGVGEKTALKLISDFGDLDSIYESLPSDRIGKSVNAKLEASRENAFLKSPCKYYQLQTLFCQELLPKSAPLCRWMRILRNMPITDSARAHTISLRSLNFRALSKNSILQNLRPKKMIKELRAQSRWDFLTLSRTRRRLKNRQRMRHLMIFWHLMQKKHMRFPLKTESSM